ncbi:hypothetical protein ACO0LM_01425 [Undibacterium sp. Di26W]|uniref:hypothetical protein n=1 Tax=Undibacterium sp. Di26W TaxID=3413035 RepID=UPI003BF16549
MDDDAPGAGIAYLYDFTTLPNNDGSRFSTLRVNATWPSADATPIWPTVENSPSSFFAYTDASTLEAVITKLNQGTIAGELRSAFEGNGRPLSRSATVEQKDLKHWCVVDPDPLAGAQCFPIAATSQELDISQRFIWTQGPGWDFDGGKFWYYTLPVGQQVSLDIGFPDLQPILLESAWGGEQITRNKVLLPGVKTNRPPGKQSEMDCVSTPCSKSTKRVLSPAIGNPNSKESTMRISPQLTLTVKNRPACRMNWLLRWDG